MWDVYNRTDLFCITTNSYIKQDRSLAMGKGIALEATRRIPGIAKEFGRRITHLSNYGLIIWERPGQQSIAAFQVKRHFRDKADLNLIDMSTKQLIKIATKYPSARFDLNFPGIGNGELPRHLVLPIIRQLPDNVYIWEKPYDDRFSGDLSESKKSLSPKKQNSIIDDISQPTFCHSCRQKGEKKMIRIPKTEKIYAIFEGTKILKMSKNKAELVEYRNSFPEEERRRMFLAEKFVGGPKEYQQSHWMFEEEKQ